MSTIWHMQLPEQLKAACSSLSLQGSLPAVYEYKMTDCRPLKAVELAAVSMLDGGHQKGWIAPLNSGDADSKVDREARGYTIEHSTINTTLEVRDLLIRWESLRAAAAATASCSELRSTDGLLCSEVDGRVLHPYSGVRSIASTIISVGEDLAHSRPCDEATEGVFGRSSDANMPHEMHAANHGGPSANRVVATFAAGSNTSKQPPAELPQQLAGFQPFRPCSDRSVLDWLEDSGSRTTPLKTRPGSDATLAASRRPRFSAMRFLDLDTDIAHACPFPCEKRSPGEDRSGGSLVTAGRDRSVPDASDNAGVDGDAS